ncbi:RHS repeat-associated core domain-containing protein [Micromonospora sp. NBC_01638]|uniref:RHS repeat-associated core domain-containing protein n=1 Tax=Micromonospora sp. NBC_01638 TaxID=2975982 RepID=UPI00386DE78A|nr:hypothetical protein OG811_21800 [Micromonospora sp. NBC_01638]
MTGRKVLITGLTSESAEYTALPNGQVEARVHAGPVRMLTGSKWIPIDLTLRNSPDGSIRSAAHPLDLKISGARGVGGELAAVGAGDNRLSMGWQGALPAPILSGNRATYPDVAPGIDLVVEATRTGFAQFVTVKNREAVDNLPDLALPLAAKSLSSFSQGSNGELTLKNSQGLPIAAVPAPEMWDAQRAPGSGEPTRRRVVVAKSERTAKRTGTPADSITMRLQPDINWLKNPATQFPVTIDPQINPLYTSFDTYVKEGDSVGRSGATDLQIGLLAGSPAAKSRAFLNWPVAGLAGKQVTVANVYFWNFWSNTCASNSWEIWTTEEASSATRWGTQPTWVQKEATSTQTKGFSSTCDDGWVSISGTNFFQRAATAGKSTAYMGVRGTDETNGNSFKQLRSRNAVDSSQVPYAVVTYNSYPSVGVRSTTPNSDCVTGSNRPLINSLTPQLKSVVTDGEASPVRAEFEWWTLTGTTKLGSVVTATGPSGNNFVGTVPAGAFSNGATYRWRVRGNDGSIDGAWSSFCEFSIDTAFVNSPSISSTKYPMNEWGGEAAVAGDFTFDPNGSADVAAYVYSLDVQPPNKVVNASAPGAPATVALTPSTAGWHTVFAQSRDAAGNLSALRSYPFKVGSAAVTSPKGGDITGAKVAINSTASSSITEVRYQWRRSGADAWTTIPLSDVTYAVGGGPVAAWPITVSNGIVPKLSWDVAATLAAADSLGIPRDGPLEIRGQFNNAGERTNRITFDRDLASADTEMVGPGAVNPITGNYKIGETDVAVPGLAISRTTNSRKPGGADPLFGPGWVSGLIISQADAPYTRLALYGNLAQVKLPDDSTIGFTKLTSAGTDYQPQVGAELYKLKFNSANNAFTLTDGEGNVVTFTRNSTDPVGVYSPTAAIVPGSGDTATYSWEKASVGATEVMRPTRMLAPVPTGVTCTTLVRGCRALTFSYATTTTATGTADGSWGNYAGRVSGISYTAWDPDLATPAMRTIAVARYSYDSTGRLRTFSDPRLDYTDGTGPRTIRSVYYYNGDGVITSMTPPGQQPWQFAYTTLPDDPGKGRLHKVTRSALSAGTAVETVVYRIPLTGSGAPYDLSGSQTARWAQAEPPTDSTAIFPPNQVPTGDPSAGVLPGSYERSTLLYLDANARTVNVAQPGGHISATSYDNYGNVLSELSPDNRKRALEASGTDNASAEAQIAEKLANSAVFSPDGQKLLETFGPEHDIVLSSGSVVRGRSHTRYSYDEGAPTAAAEPFNLATTERTSVSYVNAGQTIDADTRTTTTKYDWTLKQPTEVTIDPEGANLTTRTAYDSSGAITSITAPGGGETATTPATRSTVYYSTASNSTFPECGSRPEWADAVCRTQPAGQPEVGQPLVSTVTTYDIYGQQRTSVEKNSAGIQRTSTLMYDNAGRQLETTVFGPAGVGQPLEKRRNVYEPSTGQPIRTETINGSGVVTSQVSRVFDTLGRITSYTDADGNVSTTSYDLLSRESVVTDGKGTQTFSYDGGSERRGLPTQVLDSQTGNFVGSYNADGSLLTQEWPNGLVSTVTLNEVSIPVGINYSKPGCGQGDCTVYADSILLNAHDERSSRTSSLSGQAFSYDAAARLTSVRDTVSGECTTRSYGYDQSTNRTDLSTYAPNVGGACQQGTVQTTRNWTYDAADRVADEGYQYDPLGRTLTQPAADSASGASGAQIGYYVNDMTRSIQQGTRVSTYTLDVISNRFRSWDDSANNVTKRNHYRDDSDQPAWTDEGNGNSSRPVVGLAGIAGIFTNISGTSWVITNLHGDFVAGIAESGTGLAYTSEYTEYGKPRNSGDSGTRRYGWLGTTQRAADAPAGLVLMGVRLFNPETGRFLSSDPVYGGNANAYEYCRGDAINCVDTSGAVSCKFSKKKFWWTWWPYGLNFDISVRCTIKNWEVRAAQTIGGAAAAAAGAVGTILTLPSVGLSLLLVVYSIVLLGVLGFATVIYSDRCEASGIWYKVGVRKKAGKRTKYSFSADCNKKKKR